MRVYTIPTAGLPQGLWGLSAVMYGASSMPGVNAIYNVPQNKAIQGPDKNTGLIPGDTILIPNMSGAPAGSPSLPSAPSAPGDTVLPPVVVTPGQPVSNTTTTTTTFWTPGKIGGVAAAGVLGVALVVYLATRKKRR
jgi:hypothetical protein